MIYGIMSAITLLISIYFDMMNVDKNGIDLNGKRYVPAIPTTYASISDALLCVSVYLFLKGVGFV